MLLVIYLLYFLSGATALIYEIVWGRYLMLVTGMTTAAVGIHLATFMGGLAAGSWWTGNRASRWTYPQRRYAIMEALLGIYALLLPTFFLTARSWFSPTLSLLGGNAWLLQTLRIAATVFLIFAPSALMGATFPVVSRWATLLLERREPEVETPVAFLYALNTLGGSAACLAAAFWIIPSRGLSQTLRLAAAVNLLLALVSWLLPAPPRLPPNEAPARPIHSGLKAQDSRLSWLPWFAFWTGFASLAAEVLFTRVLLFTLTATIHSFGAVLSAFLMGMGAGSAAVAAWRKRRARRAEGSGQEVHAPFGLYFARAQMLLGMAIFGLSPVWPQLIYIAQKVALFAGESPASILGAKLVLAMVVVLPPAFFMGVSFPLLISTQAAGGTDIPRAAGRIYALNTAGSLLGPLVAAFVLVPLMGVQASLLVLALCSCLAAFALIRYQKPRSSWVWGGTALGLAIMAFLASGWSVRNSLDGDFRISKNQRLLDYAEGPASSVAVLEYVRSGYRELKIDGFPSAGTSPDYGYMRMMGHIPLLLHPSPERALVICFGTGTTAGASSLHPLKRLDIVDLERTVFSMAHWFRAANQSVLEKPFARAYVEDGRAFVQAVPAATYDIVTSEPLPPYFAGMANLYSLEYYREVSRILRPKGIACQWLPFHLLDAQETLMVVKTFMAVFPDSQLWMANYTGILLGSNHRIAISYPRIEARLRNSDVRANLADLNLDRAEILLDGYVLNQAGLTALLQQESAAILTDDHPRIEFVKPRPLFRRPQAAGSWAAPAVAQVFEIRKRLPLDVEGMPDEARKRTDQYRKFSNFVNIGKMLVTLNLAQAAQEEFQAGLREISSPALRADLFLQIGITRSKIEDWAGAEEAYTLGLQEAIEPRLQNLLLVNRARTYIRQSDFAAARQDLERVVSSDPGNATAEELLRLIPK